MELPHHKRSSCPLSCWLDLFGDKWTLLIIRDILAYGKTTNTEFSASEEAIASNILSDRLKKLLEAGIITKEPDLENGRKIAYGLTSKGKDLMPIFGEIVSWSNKHIEGTYSYEDIAIEIMKNSTKPSG